MDDVGQVLHVLRYGGELEGGVLKITGHRKGLAQPLAGEIDLRKAKVTKAPITAKILQVVGLTGIVRAMRKDGLPIKRLGAQYEYKGNKLRIRGGYARGGSIGITAEGTITFEEEYPLDFKGVVVPASGVQRIVTRIPVLGRLLAGGKNEGIIAFNYALSGTFENPKVGVNPASGLTPGFLRKVFWPRRSESKRKARKAAAADAGAISEEPAVDPAELGE